MNIKMVKSSLERSLNNPVIRFLGAVLFVSVTLWLCAVSFDYISFCAWVHGNSVAVLASPNAIVVGSIEGYSIELYTRVCMDFGIRVIDGNIAAMPISSQEFANIIYMPLVVYGLASVVSVIVIRSISSYKVRSCIAVVFFVIIYTVELGTIYYTYKLLFVDGTSNLFINSLQPFLMGILGYKNLAISNRLMIQS